jgi:nucleoside-diphosphate-sugar epimerase
MANSATRFLITGSTGFVGRQLVAQLIAKYGPAAVTAMANVHLKPTEENSLQALKKEAGRVIQCNLLDLPNLDIPVPSFDVLYHLAAYVETEKASSEIAVNIGGTKNLLNWLGRSLSGKRLVYTGTLASMDRRGRPVGPMSESTPCFPKTSYGRTKLEAEQIIQAQSARLGFDYTILRLCTILGRDFRSGGMFDVFPQLLRKNALATRLNWPGRTSLLCLSDLINILIAVPQYSQTRNELYLISNGEDPTFDQLLDQIAHTLNLEREHTALPRWLWEFIGMVAVFGSSSAFIPHSLRTFCWRVSLMVYDGIYADSSKLHAVLKPSYRSLESGLREAYAPGDSLSCT